MSVIRSLTLAAAVIGLALGVAGSSSASASAASATTPIAAVIAVFGSFAGAPARVNCDPVSGKVASCPITARLRYRLERANENGNILCRCQNPPRTIHWALQDANPFVAHVATRWYYGPTTGRPAYTLIVTIAREADGWKVDDSICAGRPTTSIYQPPAGPC